MVGIKDFDIPSCCSECQMASCKGFNGQFYCDITTYDVDMDDTERDADCPLIEAIPKDQYEARLKADLEAILVELQLEIECCEKSDCDYACSDCLSQWQIDILIQQKINALKGEEDGCNN